MVKRSVNEEHLVAGYLAGVIAVAYPLAIVPELLLVVFLFRRNYVGKTTVVNSST
jgi:hypothetical protein